MKSLKFVEIRKVEHNEIIGAEKKIKGSDNKQHNTFEY